MRIRTTKYEITVIVAAHYSKARATTLTGYKFTARFSEKKENVYKFRKAIKIDEIMNIFIKKRSKDFLILIYEDCKNEQQRLRKVTNNNEFHTRTLFSYFFSDYVHQAQH